MKGKGKNCHFEFKKVNVEHVQQLLLSINNDKPAGQDDLDGKLVKMVASHVAGPVCHIFNASIASGSDVSEREEPSPVEESQIFGRS